MPVPSRVQTVWKGVRRRTRLLQEALRLPKPGSSDVIVPGPTPDDSGSDPPTPPWVAPPTPRLVPSPVFVLCPVRSGSTLLRVLLNSHSQIRAPHEMHLRTLKVALSSNFTVGAMRELDLDQTELEYLLWDRVLHRELRRSGKEIIVDKTPANLRVWPRLHQCWPEARYVFLVRHPAAIVSSLVNRRDNPNLDDINAEVLDYAIRMEEARAALSGPMISYEDLTREPERVTGELCDYLGVSWEPEMLRYGEQEHGPFRPQLGDWSSTIKSGRVQPARTANGVEVVPELVRFVDSWGFGDRP